MPHEVVQIDLVSQQQLGEEYRAINPSCTVPALQLTDGTVFTENLGIAAYLEDRYPEPALMGSSSSEKGAILNCNAMVEFQGLMPVAEALRNSTPRMQGRAITGPENYEQIPALAERGVKRVGHFFDRLNEQLKGRDFIASHQFSLADITAVVVVDFARIVKLTPSEDKHPDLLRWRKQLSDRPSLHL